ncbi:flagellar protein FlaG [Bacillus sp. Marseille-P3661]|uniref:flagellar protein FlaG n=1 Tax=Bacillus sp. Marseille-P3661 TaxID=1936234 RepID=UPI0015E16FED|nr:flagellar protein FlaG [Bacillus sp. Marseille-P3661]
MEINLPTSKSIPLLENSSQDQKVFNSKPQLKFDIVDQNVKNEKTEDQQSNKLATTETVQKKIDSMNKLFEINNTSMKFNLHEETDRYYVQIRDQNTQKVIKEIPTKDFLDLIGRVMDYVGLLFDKKI